MELTLIFILGNELYGLEIDVIQEIIEDPVLHYVPLAEGALKGAVNFHGQVLAVIDLPRLLGFAAEKRDHRYVVLTPQYKSMVFAVSGIVRIARLDLAFLLPSSEEAEDKAIRGIAEFEEKSVKMLDTDRIITQLEHIHTK